MNVSGVGNYGRDRVAARKSCPVTTLSTLQKYAKAWESADLAAVIDAYADDVVFHYGGHTDLAGAHVGKPAALDAMAKASTRSRRTLVGIVDVLAGATRGAIVAIERFERDDQVAEVQRVLLYRVVDDQIAECWLYDDDQALIDTFWAP